MPWNIHWDLLGDKLTRERERHIRINVCAVLARRWTHFQSIWYYCLVACSTFRLGVHAVILCDCHFITHKEIRVIGFEMKAFMFHGKLLCKRLCKFQWVPSICCKENLTNSIEDAHFPGSIWSINMGQKNSRYDTSKIHRNSAYMKSSCVYALCLCLLYKPCYVGNKLLQKVFMQAITTKEKHDVICCETVNILLNVRITIVRRQPDIGNIVESCVD